MSFTEKVIQANINNYIKSIGTKSIITKNNATCNNLRVVDSYLLKVANAFYKNDVNLFGAKLPPNNYSKLSLKCCNCPSADGINYDKKNKIRQQWNEFVQSWLHNSIRLDGNKNRSNLHQNPKVKSKRLH